MRSRPLPAPLPRWFTVAEARQLGVPDGRLRRGDLVIPSRGVRGPTDERPDERAIRSAMLRTLPAHAVYSHATAAMIWRLPLPRRMQQDDGVHVTVPVTACRPRRHGVLGHRADRDWVLSGDLRVTTLLDTWCDLAHQLDVLALVQMGDALLQRESLDVAALTAGVDRSRGRRGAQRLREALRWVRPGSASPRETLVRMLFAEWGFPEPELNATVHDRSGWLATVDFLWRDRRVIAEYYGAVHGASWKRDLARVAMLEDLGWRVLVITDDDVRLRREELRRRLERVLQS